MERFGRFICRNKYRVIFLTLLLLIPALFGIKATKINYDVLVYLPEDIDTMKGEKILTDDFNMGAFSLTIVDHMEAKDILRLEDNIRDIDGVNKVVSLYDGLGIQVPVDVLPTALKDKVIKGDANLLFITFDQSTSNQKTLDAVTKIRTITKDNIKVSGMSATVLDTMNLSNQEITVYVAIAVLLCIIILMISLDSYFVPFLLLINIGIAILFNMGTNVFLGNISYITKAIASILQLGVTTDFSIFLYHKYERAKATYKDKEVAMAKALHETFVSVIGSSLTTIAGFLALCTMNLTLGKDIGIVMAKGVAFGVLGVIVLFPCLLLVFDKVIEKTTHKVFLPEFKGIKNFVIAHYKAIFIIFLLAIIPAWYGNNHTKVYYNLDKTLPSDLASSIANQELKSKFKIVSPEILMIDKNLSNEDVSEMLNRIEKVKGIDLTLSFSKLSDLGINEALLSNNTRQMFENDHYQLALINSQYSIASDSLNKQIDQVNKIVKEYDTHAIVAGEGPLMKNLVTISDEDFKNVTVASTLVIFIIMIFVLRSLSLPILLVAGIELAIFINMGIPFYTGTIIPFIASIVIGTIQLGATIDYAILMTTKYLEQRVNGQRKIEAMHVALDQSMNSILVSGMCFFAATFGVGVYSKLEMISSLCTLISRGAIISMVVVIVILPSLLLTFDKIITKTTFGFKKKERI
ncbi:MAG: MMPL family transporter [Erysipelotrichaceae bacterium]